MNGLTDTPDDIQLDPSIEASGQKTLYFGLGSVSLQVVSREKNFCVFDYQEELEGGYTTYRMRIPTTDPPVWVRRDKGHQDQAGFSHISGEIRTSFDVEKGEIVVLGNVHNGHRETAASTLATAPASTP